MNQKELNRRTVLFALGSWFGWLTADHGANHVNKKDINPARIKQYFSERYGVVLSEEEMSALDFIQAQLGQEGLLDLVYLERLGDNSIGTETKLLGFEKIGYDNKKFLKFLESDYPKGTLTGNVNSISIVLGSDRMRKMIASYIIKTADIKVFLPEGVESMEGLEYQFNPTNESDGSFYHSLSHEVAHANSPWYKRGISFKERTLFLKELIDMYNKYSKNEQFLQVLKRRELLQFQQDGASLSTRIAEFWAVIFMRVITWGDFKDDFTDLRDFCLKWATLKDPGYLARIDEMSEDEYLNLEREARLEDSKKIVVRPSMGE